MQRDKRYLSTFGFIDLLFNMLVGFVFLFFIAYILINPIADEGKVDPPDVAMVVVNWDRDSKLDVDIWVKDPLNNILSFTNKNVPGMHLERDDLGFQNDILNGKVINPGNQEVVHFTKLLQGTYQVSIHLYSPHGDKLPQNVTVEFMTIKKFMKLGKKEVVVSSKGQEQPIFSFKADDRDQVVDLDWSWTGTIVDFGKVNSIQTGQDSSLSRRDLQTVVTTNTEAPPPTEATP